jgi:hypothetical protein
VNTKEFVSFLRVFLSDKKKLSKSQVEELKYLLDDVYNELPQDIVIRDYSSPSITKVEPLDYTPRLLMDKNNAKDYTTFNSITKFNANPCAR